MDQIMVTEYLDPKYQRLIALSNDVSLKYINTIDIYSIIRISLITSMEYSEKDITETEKLYQASQIIDGIIKNLHEIKMISDSQYRTLIFDKSLIEDNIPHILRSFYYYGIYNANKEKNCCSFI